MHAVVRRLRPHLAYLLILAAGLAAWLPLIAAGGTTASAAATPVVDQWAEMRVGGDLVSDAGGLRQFAAPSFNSLCAGDDGRWAQTFTASLTAQLAEVELLVLRRSPDIASPVRVEVRAVGADGQPADTVLGHGMTTAAIPVHRSEPGWLRVTLDVPVQVLRGQTYAIFPTATRSPSGACYEWVSPGVDVYAGGSLAETTQTGMGLRMLDGQDAAFRTLVR